MIDIENGFTHRPRLASRCFGFQGLEDLRAASRCLLGYTTFWYTQAPLIDPMAHGHSGFALACWGLAPIGEGFLLMSGSLVATYKCQHPYLGRLQVIRGHTLFFFFSDWFVTVTSFVMLP